MTKHFAGGGLVERSEIPHSGKPPNQENKKGGSFGSSFNLVREGGLVERSEIPLSGKPPNQENKKGGSFGSSFNLVREGGLVERSEIPLSGKPPNQENKKGGSFGSSFNLVREGGLEPPRLVSATPSRWCVCHFATPAMYRISTNSNLFAVS